MFLARVLTRFFVRFLARVLTRFLIGFLTSISQVSG